MIGKSKPVKMPLWTRAALSLAGATGVYTAFTWSFRKALEILFNYVEHFYCGCQRPPLIIQFALTGVITASEFLLHRYWIAYPLFVATLLPLWLRMEKRRRLAECILLPQDVGSGGIWPPAPKA